MKYFLLIFIFFSQHIFAAEIHPIGLRGGKIGLYIKGVIEQKDVLKFTELIQIAGSSNQVIAVVYLDSPGGSVQAGYELARLTRRANLQTFVPSNSMCASACFMIFMAGSPRFYGDTAKIGVHSVSTANSQETLDAMRSTVLMSRYLSDLGTPPIIIGRLVTARPKEMAWLRAAELNDIANVVLLNPPKQEEKHESTPDRPARTAVSMSERSQARQLNAEAITHLTVFNYLNALPLLKKASELAPYDAEIQGNLGYAFFLAKDFARARDTLALGLNLKRTRGSTWVNLGQAVAALNDLDWATECFVNYLKYSSNKAAALNQLRHFRDQQGGVIGQAAATALN